MASSDFIPAGRTSRIVRGTIEVQIQTEYACRPGPRLTTSLFKKGQLIHKIEQELPAPVNSFEDKIRVEDLLRKQHMEVLKIIQDKKASLQFMHPSTPPANEPLPDVSPETADALISLEKIPGVEKIFQLDNEGNFSGGGLSDNFRRKYSAVFRNMSEIINIFEQLPGSQREQGVVEIEPDRLYFASGGRECFFILVRPLGAVINFESEIKKAIVR